MMREPAADSRHATAANVKNPITNAGIGTSCVCRNGSTNELRAIGANANAVVTAVRVPVEGTTSARVSTTTHI